jgi:hypothetical protein
MKPFRNETDSIGKKQMPADTLEAAMPRAAHDMEIQVCAHQLRRRDQGRSRPQLKRESVTAGLGGQAKPWLVMRAS